MLAAYFICLLLFPSWHHVFICKGFPESSVGKESACNAGDPSLIPGPGRYPGEANGYPLQYSGLDNAMDCIVHRVAKSWTGLRDFHFHLRDNWPRKPSWLIPPPDFCWVASPAHTQVFHLLGQANFRRQSELLRSISQVLSSPCSHHFASLGLKFSHLSNESMTSYLQRMVCGIQDKRQTWKHLVSISQISGGNGRDRVILKLMLIHWAFIMHQTLLWRRKWQPTPVFLPSESCGQRSLVGCRLWGRTESDMTEAT